MNAETPRPSLAQLDPLLPMSDVLAWARGECPLLVPHPAGGWQSFYVGEYRQAYEAHQRLQPTPRLAPEPLPSEAEFHAAQAALARELGL